MIHNALWQGDKSSREELSVFLAAFLIDAQNAVPWQAALRGHKAVDVQRVANDQALHRWLTFSPQGPQKRDEQGMVFSTSFHEKIASITQSVKKQGDDEVAKYMASLGVGLTPQNANGMQQVNSSALAAVPMCAALQPPVQNLPNDVASIFAKNKAAFAVKKAI